jgi:hypothetical protein
MNGSNSQRPYHKKAGNCPDFSRSTPLLKARVGVSNVVQPGLAASARRLLDILTGSRPTK